MSFPQKYREQLYRKKTFEAWINSANPTAMAESGFFYCGVNDTVECFSCGLKLHSWKVTDVPDVEHLKYSPQCLHMKQRCRFSLTLHMHLIVGILEVQQEFKEKIKSLEKHSSQHIRTQDEVDTDSFKPLTESGISGGCSDEACPHNLIPTK